MSTDTLDSGSLNSFAGLAGQVQPEEQLITLTLGQLQDLITAAVDKAIQPLQDRIASLESTQDTQAENQLIQLRLIGQLREDTQKTAAPTSPKGARTLARVAKIDEILKARGSTTLKEMERILKIRPQEMSRIVARLDKRRYEIFLRAGDEREKVLRLKAQIR